MIQLLHAHVFEKKDTAWKVDNSLEKKNSILISYVFIHKKLISNV